MKMKKAIPALPVQDIQQAIVFYTEKLGFSFPHYDEGFAIAVRDEVEIHLWRSNDESWKSKGAALAQQPIVTGAESFLAGTHSCRIEVRDIDILFEEYKGKDVLHQVSTQVKEQPWGAREFHALDHHGNLLSFYEEV